ncbi:MAG: glycerol-3-phosphate 1-O-acyltransferase PlsY [Owenweeksia sp.]|nr:glycerol-3-phosphate 1-O-acyltransferase PlsY [Owenweeksia sp.]
MKLVLLIFAYLLGSIPTAVWLGRSLHNIDLRDFGSGNAGATNSFRVLGTYPGLAVLILDTLKGFAAVNLIYLIPRFHGNIELMVILGVCAVIGHIFPVFAQFKGGKGIATLLGMIVAIHAGAALMAIMTFLLFFLSFRIVSLSSILAALSFPCWLIFRYHEDSNVLVIFSFALAFLVLLTHQKNLERLLNGEERKIRPKNRQDEDA